MNLLEHLTSWRIAYVATPAGIAWAASEVAA